MNYMIGTRGSKLALAQAEYVRGRLSRAYPMHTFDLRIIRTAGDKILDKPLSEIGQKGIFVKEIESEILDGTVDIGVHSMKDMPGCPAPGLIFTAAWTREDPRDVLVLREAGSLQELREGAVIATGSKRRKLQLKGLRPDLNIVGIRGNVDTRLKKMHEEQLDGLVLAAAGLHRLGMQRMITQYLDPEDVVPAPAQGVLALEIRAGDTGLFDLLNALSDADCAGEINVERLFLQEMGGGCHLPVGAFCRRVKEGGYSLLAMFGNEGGSRMAKVSVAGGNPGCLVQEAAVCIRRQIAGMVYLVGAGPGDPGLVTVNGLKVIKKAGCIVYDRLVPVELLSEAPDGCELIYAGKENRRHVMEQEEINRLLVQKSMEYDMVVRLKGGDPYVFGRGSEEGIYLTGHGVPFAVVPGVTSAVAACACAGIPVTHRGMASGFHAVTAHSQNGGLADIDFEAMAAGRDTCIFMMGLSKTAEIVDRLMGAGMPPDTAAAVISCACTPDQNVCVSDLRHISEVVKEAGICAPAVIAVGEVVSLRKKLDVPLYWPLAGKHYLIPKIGAKTTRLAELLREKGAGVQELKVGQIVYTKRRFTAEELRGISWLVFTSKNGVEAFFSAMGASGLDLRLLAGCRIAVVGKKTGEELMRHGLYADLMPEVFEGKALLAVLKGHVRAGECVWYVKAANADHYLRDALTGMCRFKEVVLYENRAQKPDFAYIRQEQGFDGVLFTCASSAERFLDAVGEDAKRYGRYYCIGERTMDCLKGRGIQGGFLAGQASYEGLVELLLAENSVGKEHFRYE